MEEGQIKITTNKPKNISINQQNQTTISTPEYQTNNQTDTVTNVYIRLDEPKVTVSFSVTESFGLRLKSKFELKACRFATCLNP
jgi:hypothetical protein